MPLTDRDDDHQARELDSPADSEPVGTIEFALMLDRAIEAISHDRELLRAAVYQLARIKLREQLDNSSSDHSREGLASLEIAIQKVEAFSKSQPALLFDPASNRPAHPLPLPSPQAFGRKLSPRRKWTGYILAVLAAAGVISAIIASRALFSPSPPATMNLLPERPASVASQEAPKRKVPPVYGAYAIVGDTFVELEPLALRAPDLRVAVSAQLDLPVSTPLETTKPTFLIYERFPPAVARADARILAKVVSDTPNAPNRKWVIRNISTPIPVMIDPQRSDVLLISPNADVELKPGRYALVLGSKAYEFTLAGSPDRTTHCLSHLTAQNGTFYVPCR